MKWARPGSQRQLRRMLSGMHPLHDVPLGTTTAAQGACEASAARARAELLPKTKAWMRSGRSQSKKSRTQKRAKGKFMFGDDFHTLQETAPEGNGAFTPEAELIVQRCARADLTHVQGEIEQLERAAKKIRNEQFTKDAANDDLLKWEFRNGVLQKIGHDDPPP